MSNETVYVASGWSRNKKYYHESKDACRAARKAHNLQPWDREQAEQQDKEPCTYCYGEHTTNNYDNSYQKALKKAAEGSADE